MASTPQALTLVSQLARGGFGRVEKVRDADRSVLARKVFDPSPELGIREERELAKLRKRFEREVRVQMALAKYGMMPIVRAELDADPPWFLMPLADKNYADQIREDRDAGTISPEPLLDILNGLEELHRLGYAHRDLKPDNVLLYEGTWRLSDFGLVADVEKHETTRLTSTASIWGSQLYMAPEQTQDFHRAKAPADIYAFGCILHDLVDGGARIPYAVQTVKGAFDTIVRKCTATEPKRRFNNVAGLRAACVNVLKRKPSLQRSDATREWSKALDNIQAWSDEQGTALAAHLEETKPGDEAAVIAELSEDHLNALASRFPEEWERIALAYCEWATGGFAFSFCDVIVGRLESVFRNAGSSLDARAAALVSAAELGSGHNRWFVMGRVVRMGDGTMDENLAERVAVEIQAANAEAFFRRCADHINRSVTAYHPRIAAVLSPKSLG
jgi:hypothetical protein